MTPTKPWDDIIAFWFGETGEGGSFDVGKNALWWGHSPETDALIGERFGDRIRAATERRLDWAEDPVGRLALVLLIDQMRRSVFRGTAEMYAADAVALELVLEGLNLGVDRRLHPIQRTFFYLPLEHTEELRHQDRCVSLSRQLAEQVTDQRDAYANFVDYAVRHRDIVARFGRFPHRNEILGRSSTAEEVVFLTQPGSSF